MKTLIRVIRLGALTVPVAGFAQRTRDLDNLETGGIRALQDTGFDTGVEQISDVQGIVQDVVGWFQIFFYTFAVIFILLGAWDYLSSGGEAEKTKSGRNKIIYGLVAIAIAVIAGGVTQMVFSFVEGNRTTPSTNQTN